MNSLNVIREWVGMVFKIDVGSDIKGSGSWVGYGGMWCGWLILL